MKVLSTDGLTKLIQLIKSAFISVDDTVSTNAVTLADVATSGSYDDLTITDEAKISMSKMGMPSDSYINLTLGASGTTYTMPANGWLILSNRGLSSGDWLTIDNNYFRLCSVAPTTGAERCISMPVRKNDKISITYHTAGETVRFRFFYAIGSESEVENA